MTTSDKKFICEECYKIHERHEDLQESYACADSDVGYGVCCTKFICNESCEFKCIICNNNFDQAKKMKKIISINKNIDFNLDNLSKHRERIFVCKLCLRKYENKDSILEDNIILTLLPYDEDEELELRNAKVWFGISSKEWLARYD